MDKQPNNMSQKIVSNKNENLLRISSEVGF